MKIYLTLECEGCDSYVYQLNFVLDEHRGIPALPADLGANTRFDCDRCGTINWTGDLAVLAEQDTDGSDEVG